MSPMTNPLPTVGGDSGAWGTKLNAYLTELQGQVLSGLSLCDFTYSTDTNNTDPGAGGIKVNNLAFGSSTTSLRISETDANGKDISALLKLVNRQAYTQCTIIMRKKSDPTIFAAMRCRAQAVDNGTWNSISIKSLAKFGSNFTNGDAVTVEFQFSTDTVRCWYGFFDSALTTAGMTLDLSYNASLASATTKINIGSLNPVNSFHVWTGLAGDASNASLGNTGKRGFINIWSMADDQKWATFRYDDVTYDGSTWFTFDVTYYDNQTEFAHGDLVYFQVMPTYKMDRIRVGTAPPSGKPVKDELPFAHDTTPTTGGFYYWNQTSWVKII